MKRFMGMRTKAACWIGFPLALLCGSMAGAFDAQALAMVDVVQDGPDTLQEVIRNADHIARVKIEDRAPVRDSLGGQVCGYIYGVHVVEPFKGRARTFRFFSASPSDFPDQGGDYLVFTFPSDATIESGITTAAAQKAKSCVAPGSSFAATTFESVFQFDRFAAQQLKGEWVQLGPHGKSSFHFCGSTAKGVSLPTFTALQEGRSTPQQQGVWHHVASWEFLRSVLQDELGGRRGRRCPVFRG